MALLRTCYLLTCDPESRRAQFSKAILEQVGFSVNLFKSIPHVDKVISNKESMVAIYGLIANGDEEWVYVFEDDINILEKIKLQEIIPYERISTVFFYLGVCAYGDSIRAEQQERLDNRVVTIVSGDVRGLHATAFSKEGAKMLLSFIETQTKLRFMDMILEAFSIRHPANVVRYDLESSMSGHRGVFFQDRVRFPSSID